MSEKTEILLNRLYGGFKLSHAALRRFNELRAKAGLESVGPDYFRPDDMELLKARRTDRMLFAVLLELKEKCQPDAMYGIATCELYVCAIENDLDWEIEIDDGKETVKMKE